MDQPVRILIVEDEIIVAEQLRQELMNFHYEIVSIAVSSGEALRLTREHHPDLIFMDIHLQDDKDGIETAELINQEFDIPIIYLTAYADEETLKRAQQTQPFGYLLKPYCLNELKSTIEMVIYKHRMEKKLKEREQWLDTVLQSIEDAVIATDAAFQILFMNPAAEKITDYAQSQAIGRPIWNIVTLRDDNSENDANILTRWFELPLVRRLPCNHLHLMTPGQKAIPVLVSITPIQSSPGKNNGAVIVIKDVTERQELEESYHQHQDMLAHVNRVNTIEQMTTALAHEINQPLTAISTLTDGCLQLFRSDRPALNDIRSAMEEVSSQARRAGEIIRHIRQFVKNRDSTPHKFDLNVLARRIILLAKPELAMNQTAFSLNLVPIPLIVDADELQIEQVLLNLIRNGLEAMTDVPVPQRTITVTSALDKGFCRISVSDQGIGIPADVAGNLYRSFFSTKPNGLGIGLALCKSIIKNFGGQLWHKNNPKQGVTFHFTLPYCRNAIQSHPRVLQESPQELHKK